MVVGFSTTYAISAYHHWSCEFESQSGWGVQHDVIKFATGLWFSLSLGTPVSSTNKTDHHDNGYTHNRWNIVESGVKHYNSNSLFYYHALLAILIDI